MKLHNLTIENFRSFDRFTLNNLGRVNLLVGTNNSGKTTVLEAIYLLMASRKLWSMWDVLSRRGELLSDESRVGSSSFDDIVADFRCLFHEYSLELGSKFTISGQDDSNSFNIRASIASAAREYERVAFHPSTTGDTAAAFTNFSPLFDPLLLTITSTDAIHDLGNMNITMPLDHKGGLTQNILQQWLVKFSSGRTDHPVKYMTAASLDGPMVTSFFNDIVLTDMEDLVVDALRGIEPRIVRIAVTGASTAGLTNLPGVSNRRGLRVRLAGVRDPVPIGSMGDGIWRMLGLALAAVDSQNGILLIDEIDTGLHYSVMGKMWQFLNECSQRFNVQIIATTQSRDCYQSLAEICREGVIGPSEVTIQRIDRKRAEAVAYSEAAIIAAAEHDVEVR